MSTYDRATLRDMARYALEARDRRDPRWQALLARLQARTGLRSHALLIEITALAYGR